MNISPLFVCFLFALFDAIIAAGGVHSGEVQTDTVVEDSRKDPMKLHLSHEDHLPLRKKGQSGKKLCLVTPAKKVDKKDKEDKKAKEDMKDNEDKKDKEVMEDKKVNEGDEDMKDTKDKKANEGEEDKDKKANEGDEDMKDKEDKKEKESDEDMKDKEDKKANEGEEDKQVEASWFDYDAAQGEAQLIDYDAALLSKQLNLLIQDKESAEENGEAALKNAKCIKLAEDEEAEVHEVVVMNVDAETLAKVIRWCHEHVDIFYEEEEKAKAKAAEEGKAKAAEEGKVVAEEQIPPIPAYAVEKESKVTEKIPKWFTKLLEDDKQQFYELIKAANYLEVPPMIEMLSSTIVKDLMWRPADEIRKLYNIVDDPKQAAEAVADDKDMWRFEL